MIKQDKSLNVFSQTARTDMNHLFFTIKHLSKVRQGSLDTLMSYSILIWQWNEYFEIFLFKKNAGSGLFNTLTRIIDQTCDCFVLTI